jgi:hypothetical protein
MYALSWLERWNAPSRGLSSRKGRPLGAQPIWERWKMTFSDFTRWLLTARTPSIRYLTLRDLLGRREEDADLQAAWQAMQTTGPIPALLRKQTKDGNWAGERSYYTPKYTSTHWSMLLLAELAADGDDPSLRRGAAFMLAATQEELDQSMAKGAHGLSCFWGNLLRYALHCGYADDPRVEAIIRYLAHDARRGSWRCRHNDELPCAWGAARALWGLAAVLPGQRSSDAEAAIKRGLTFLLEAHQLREADYPTPGQAHPLWFRLNFPLFYQADILFVLRVLGELGALDHPGAQRALEWLIARRRRDGHWRGANPFKRRTWQMFGDRDETDRWVSLQAAMILQESARVGNRRVTPPVDRRK